MALQRISPVLTRRRLIAGACLAAPGLIARSARAADSVTIMGLNGWFQAAFDSNVLGAFRKTHPQIQAYYYPVGNSFQALGLLRDQRSLPLTGIALLQSGVAAHATAEGLLEPLDPVTMPVLKDLIPQASIAGTAGPALMLDSLALGYGPAHVPRAPRTWRDLWDTAYGQRIALQTPPDSVAMALTAVAAGLYGGGGPARSLEAGLTALGQLAPRVVVWEPDPDVYTVIAGGDADIGPGWNAQAQNQAAQAPGRFAATVPDDGSPVIATTISLIKGAPGQAAARTLIAWLLGPEGQRLLTETMYFAPVNARAVIQPAALARAGATPALVARRKEIDWTRVDEMRNQIAAAWRSRNLGTP